MTRREARSTTVERAVGGGDVGVEMEIGAEDGGSMLAEKNDDGENEEESEEKIDAEVFAMGHEESLQFTVFGLSLEEHSR